MDEIRIDLYLRKDEYGEFHLALFSDAGEEWQLSTARPEELAEFMGQQMKRWAKELDVRPADKPEE